LLNCANLLTMPKEQLSSMINQNEEESNYFRKMIANMIKAFALN
jgi:hypothetical protein